MTQKRCTFFYLGSTLENLKGIYFYRLFRAHALKAKRENVQSDLNRKNVRYCICFLYIFRPYHIGKFGHQYLKLVTLPRLNFRSRKKPSDIKTSLIFA